MASRYIRPEVNFKEEVPNNPFSEGLIPMSDFGIQTTGGTVSSGDLIIVEGKLRVQVNNDYGTF